MQKVLIIRFSSFGDVTQTLSVPSKLKLLSRRDAIEVHWVTRADFAPLLQGHPNIDRTWFLQKKEGLSGLFRLISQLQKQKFTHVYDAHNNLRSRLICLCLAPPIFRLFTGVQLLRKSQKRWKRFLLFQLHKNTYRMPFSGQRDLLEPLAAWGIDESLPATPQFFISADAKTFVQNWQSQNQIKEYFCFAASAAHALKRWPLSHWEKLITLHPDQVWVALGGPEDLFLNELCKKFPKQILNMAGKTDFQKTAALIKNSQALITNDTGVLHIGEQLGHPVIALMGPAPFGFPSRSTTKILELQLSCRPCSKHGQGPCTNSTLQKCLVDISPEFVSENLRMMMNGKNK